jgi:hypothetical protein
MGKSIPLIKKFERDFINKKKKQSLFEVKWFVSEDGEICSSIKNKARESSVFLILNRISDNRQ